MLWIGITGPMGSGKSTVASELRHMGFEVLDADQLARAALDPGTVGETEVFRTFGELRGPDGALDRRALGRLVFRDKQKLLKLEAIVHPLVRAATQKKRTELQARGATAGFYDVPLLFEKNMRDQFDAVFVISAPAPLRHQRLRQRSQLTLEEIEERTRHHLPAEVKEAAASAVIRNTGTRDELRAEIINALVKVGVSLPAAT